MTRLSNKMVELLNNQYNEEHFNDAFYQSIENWADENDYPGLAHWMHLQAIEEREHAYKFKEYLNSMHAPVIKKDVKPPKTDFKDVVDAWDNGITAEKNTTNNIFDIYNLAKEEKDSFTENFIQWFIEEQRQEEDTFITMYNYSVKDKDKGFMHVDKLFHERKE